jgi:hypothetical protein
MLDTLRRTVPQFSAESATIAPSLDALISQPSLGKRAFRAVLRFVIVFCIGAVAVVAWQSYGDLARSTIATSWPDLAWLAPGSTPTSQIASDMVTTAPPATPSSELQQIKEDLAQLRQELQQLKEIPSVFASLRQSVDQLAVSQRQMASDATKVGTRQLELLHKLASPAQRPAAPPAPKPVAQPPSEGR